MIPVPDILQVDGLSAGPGDLSLVRSVSLTLAAASWTWLTGSNGAGKSTLLRAILGLTPTHAGQIICAGQDVTGWSPERRVRLGMGYVPEGRRVFAGMSVCDNLAVASWQPKAERGADLEQVYGLFPALRDKRAEHAWRLSGGQQQMLAIGRALMGRPRVLLLDEPTLGLSPRLADEVLAAVVHIVALGTTVLLADSAATMTLASSRSLGPDSLPAYNHVPQYIIRLHLGARTA